MELYTLSPEPAVDLAKEFRRFRATVVQDALAEVLGRPDGEAAGVGETARQDVTGELLAWLSFDETAEGSLVAFLFIKKSEKPFPPAFWKTPQGKRALVLGVGSAHGKRADADGTVWVHREQIRTFEDWYAGVRGRGHPLPQIKEQLPFKSLVNPQNASLNNKTAIRNASSAAIKTQTEVAATKLGHRKETQLWKAVKDALPENHVPRASVRKAIEKLWGKPGRIGAPSKSPK